MRWCVLLLLVVGCGSPAPPPAPPPPPAAAPVAVAPSPSPSPSPVESAASLTRQGARLVAEQKFEEALAVLKRAEALEADDPEVQMQLYLCQRGLDSAEAATHARRYLELAPDSLPAPQVKRYLDGRVAVEKVGGLLGTRQPGRLKDLPGWGGLKWGMDSKQVSEKLGGVLKPFTGQYSNPGNVVPFSIPDLPAQGVNWSALFPFSNETGLLAGVYLRPSSYPGGTREDFDRLEKWLTERLGPPARDDLDNPMASRLRREWALKTTVVRLNLYNGGDLSLLFKPAE